MKKFTRGFISLLVIVSLMIVQIYEISAAVAADGSALVQIAKYTLNNTAVDSTGIQTNITLKNAPHQADGSVYSNGIYPYPDASVGSTIQTPWLSSFNFNNFRISFDFKVTSLPSYRKPIIIGGSAYRWIGANIEPNGTISLLWNNSNFTFSTKTISLGVFNTAVISYNGAVAELYLNGTLACSQGFTLNNGGDSNFLNINYSNGSAFPGYLRNLEIYSTPSLYTIAKYTLNNTAADSTSRNSNITLTNASFMSDGSIYSNGIYPYSSTLGSTVRTPNLKAFNFNNFRVSFEFKINSYPTSRKPIIVGGNSYRWIGANIESNGTISLLWNNSNYTYSSKTVTLGTYHTAIIQYNGSVAELYFDGILVCSQYFKPVNGGDANFQNTNYSNGTTFLGYLRNLTVYSAPSTPLVAKYTLNNTAADLTGKNSNVTLNNAPYQSDGSVYSNGIYPYSSPTGSVIQTPYLSSFNFNKFSISFEFKIDSLPSYRRPIIIGGSSYRWIGANVEPNGTISMLWNNSNITNSSKTIPLGKFNTAVIQYNGSVAELYINGTLACSQSFSINHGKDSNIQNVNYSNGTAFIGYLRNLTVN
ncbi:LamG-like jellyroll fold domain-containing protein [Pseudobacteroides cellulosolvens]|uniref:Uncharacterized protein n=1 Tax=Pseudobacteroides cellulosolvens ATCC 35603 = DSM 2933 TaxID=398512 RepID=A0A0L6JUP8_9FIRM|nr:LamG-like jellyroll fold domain-containing protein [Pseudobacteroides cellulosolvens]KNY29152.1 hypothetical protein Bccel_4426 [Pseudobacteroides cellulosolvens ATCC 35603 = DSM 2933]